MQMLWLTGAIAVIVAPAAAGSATLAQVVPLRIQSCVVNGHREQAAAFTTAVDMTYTLVNTSAKSITEITVSGKYNGLTLTDSLAAQLAPGNTTASTKRHSPVAFIGHDVACSVEKVTFSDGTSWTTTKGKM